MLDALEKHPAVIWGGIILTVLSVLTGGGRSWWVFEDWARNQAVWYAEDVKWNNEILALLRELASEQDEQVRVLSGITDLVNRHWAQREDRFEELESEHKLLMTLIAVEAAEWSYRAGLQDGRKGR